MFQVGLKGDLSIGSEVIRLILDIGGYHKNVFTIAPSLEIRSEIDLALAALDVAITRSKHNSCPDDERASARKNWLVVAHRSNSRLRSR